MQYPRLAPAARAAGAGMAALGLALAPATADAAGARPAASHKQWLDPAAGWRGRAIEQPRRHTGRRPGGASRVVHAAGTGRGRPFGSAGVRLVQERLRQLGYRPGPVDGVLGPRTRAALGWFQVKHGLPVDGRATLATLRRLRARTDGRGDVSAALLAPHAARRHGAVGRPRSRGADARTHRIRGAVPVAGRRGAAVAIPFGAGFGRPGGSQRVRRLQLRLRRLGYRPGAVDGVLGPRTRAAVGWFQLNAGLRVGGRATYATLRRLRARTAPRPLPGRQTRRERTRTPGRGDPWAAFRALVSRPAAISATAEPESRGSLLWWLGGLAVATWAMALAAILRARRRTPARSVAVAPAAAPRALGYLRAPAEKPGRAGMRDRAAAIEAACAGRGIALVGVVCDMEEDKSAERPGLAVALDRLAAGEADCLLIGDAAELPRALDPLLASRVDDDAALVVLHRSRAGDRPQPAHAGPALAATATGRDHADARRQLDA